MDRLENEFVLVFFEEDFVVVEDRPASQEHGEVIAVGDEDLDVRVAVLVPVAMDGHRDPGAGECGLPSRGVDAACSRELQLQELRNRIGDDDEIPTGIEEGVDERRDPILGMEFDGDQGIVVILEDQRL